MSEATTTSQLPTLLIVDDSLTVRMDLHDRFEERGYPVCAAATLAEARTVLATKPIGLLLLDVQLPDGDGVTFLQDIRADGHADLPVVLLSSADDVKHRLRGLHGGAQEFAGKPYDGHALVAMVERCLALRPDHEAERVLLIDDSATYRGQMGERLRDAGYSVLEAADGHQGLRSATLNQPAAILCDGQLPDIDGAEVIRRIRLNPAIRDVPCLMLTGSGLREAEITALRAGADDFVDKAQGVDLVLGKLRAVLRAAPRRISAAQTPQLSRRVLTVDDSESFLQATAERLRASGFDVVLARSGQEALDLLAIQPVDCVLLDWQMPGLSGEETVRQIRADATLAGLPVLMLSAHEEEAVMLAGMRAGADDFVTKRGGFDVLCARVDAHMRRKQHGDEVRRLEQTRLRAELTAREAEARHDREQAALRAKMIGEVERVNAQLAVQNRTLAAQQEEITQFAWVTSHDLMTPLRSVHMFAELLARRLGPSLDEESAEDLQHIRAGASRMRDLVRGLQGYLECRGKDDPRDRVDLAEILRRAQMQLAGAIVESAAEVHVGALPVVLGTARQWAQVVTHLLDNATRYRAERPLKIAVEAQPHDGRRWRISVRDNGRGFDPNHAEKIFHLFNTLDESAGRAGVGLSICRRIVEHQGGEIWFSAEPGRGATFYFTALAADPMTFD